MSVILFPILFPLFVAIILLFLRNNNLLLKVFSIISGLILVVGSIFVFYLVNSFGIYSVQVGGWKAPFGITIVADLLSAIMVGVTGFVSFIVLLYKLTGIDEEVEQPLFYPLFFLLIMGVNGAFLTGDVFNLYVWYEVMLITSFVLTTLGNTGERLAAGMKYVVINLIASAIFLISAGILYGITGTLNMADLYLKITETSRPEFVTILSLMFLISFGIKSAIFPLFFWLPASYHTPPLSTTALFSALLTKVGVYSLLRFNTLIFYSVFKETQGIIIILAGFTMIVGVLGAIAQNDIRRLLSFHIVSQIGYMIMGLGFFTVLGIAGAIFYMLNNIFAKTNLFLIAGVLRKHSKTFDVKNMGGVLKQSIPLSILFALSALTLVGFPPLTGFWGKLMLAKSGFESGNYLVAGISIFVGLLTLFSMIKIWNEAFLKEGITSERIKFDFRVLLPIFILALVPVLAGLYFDAIFPVIEKAASQLIDPQLYINKITRVN